MAAHPATSPVPVPSEPTPPGSTPLSPTPPGFGVSPSTQKNNAFYGSVDVPPATAKVRLVQIAEEVIALLAKDPNATVKVTVEISSDFPEGASDQIKRAVSENASTLGFKTKAWE